MATTLQDSQVTVSISEEKLQGRTTGTTSKNHIASSSIREFIHAYRKISTGFTDLLEFKASPTESGAQFDADLVKHIRITNLDDSAEIGLAFVYGEQITGTVGTFTIKLRAGESFIMGNPIEWCYEVEGAPERDLLKIRARGLNLTTPDVEVVVASE
jgi:hypothetical protein